MSTPAARDRREIARRRGLLVWPALPLTLLLLGASVNVVLSADTPAGKGVLGAAAPSPTPSAAAGSPALGSGGAVQSSSQAASGGNHGNGNGNTPGHAINVAGVVTGRLGPGSPAILVVTVGNTNNQDILVTSVTGSVTSVTTGHLAGKPQCQVAWYSVGNFAGSLLVTKNSSANVPLPVTFADLASTNQDNCKGATYTFTFTAQARQA